MRRDQKAGFTAPGGVAFAAEAVALALAADFLALVVFFCAVEGPCAASPMAARQATTTNMVSWRK